MKSRNRKAQIVSISFFLLSDIDRNKVRHENSDGEFDFELTLADGLTVLALQGSSFQVGSL